MGPTPLVLRRHERAQTNLVRESASRIVEELDGWRVDDSGDFDELFDKLFPQAALMAYRILGDRAAAEDVAAEALARALARWPKVGWLPHREAWILRVAVNLAVDVARRKHPEPPPGRVEIEAGELATLRVALARALVSLPRRQREVIGLRYLSGLTDREVAQALGMSEGTVRTHARRGLRTMRSRLDDDDSVEEQLGFL
jgi:RNA polymerase sigma factor (sigma-70 family)